jgi:penicillin-binding protein 1C
MDPRIADDREAFVFRLANLKTNRKVDWYVDDKRVATTRAGEYLWPLRRGVHSVRARIWPANSGYFNETAEVSFIVK